MFNLVISVANAEEYRSALQPRFPDVSLHVATDDDQLADYVEEMDALFAFRIPDDLLRRASRLQWIQSLASGVDYLISLPSLRDDVLVTSTRGIHGPQMSEMALLLMLSLGRDFPAMVRNQDLAKWEPWPAKLLWHKKVGILGLGAIGEEIAKKCRAFDMTVYGIDIVPKELEFVDRFFHPRDIGTVAAEVDFLVLVAPYTPQTHQIVDAGVLAAMKSTAFLVNIAGELVDEQALVEALDSGKIAGAALDAFVEEPLPPDHPFWRMRNVIVTPHVGGPSDTYVHQALPILEENLRRFLSGERKNLINLIRP